GEALGEQADVEAQARVAAIAALFGWREQVEEQGADAAPHDLVGDKAVARAQAAAAAAVREEHDAPCAGWQPDLAGQRCVRGADGDVTSCRRHATIPPKAACASARSSSSRPA